jgi:hypothetical protein
LQAVEIFQFNSRVPGDLANAFRQNLVNAEFGCAALRDEMRRNGSCKKSWNFVLPARSKRPSLE